jgi:hypothetical protein
MARRKKRRSDFDSPWKEALEYFFSHFQWEEEQRMPYVTSIERLAKEEGIEQGRWENIQENIAISLQVRFGASGKRLTAKVRKITDLDQLRALFQTILKAESLAEVRRKLSD